MEFILDGHGTWNCRHRHCNTNWKILVAETPAEPGVDSCNRGEAIGTGGGGIGPEESKTESQCSFKRVIRDNEYF